MMSTAINVIVRVRPFTDREKEAECQAAVCVDGDSIQVGYENDAELFTFDRCYWSTDSSHHSSSHSHFQVCEELSDDVIRPVLDGLNTSVIIYGQSRSGKSTTLGTTSLMTSHPPAADAADIGLLQLVSQKLMSLTEMDNVISRTEVSLMEVYNEYVVDLLSRGSNAMRSALKVREHPKTGPYVQGLSKHLVRRYDDILQLLNHAASVATTGRNFAHVVFSCTFTQARFIDGIPSDISRKIQLIDTADRRPVQTMRSSGDERQKAESINRSLLTFTNVITWLADAVDSRLGCVRRRRRSVYIPYCDSCLTWLLKDSLGVNSQTIFIATVSPCVDDVTHTLNTLRLATKARRVTNKPVVNEDISVVKIRELWDENNALRVQLGDCGRQQMYFPMRQFAEAQEKLKRNDELIKNLTNRWINKWTTSVGMTGRDFEVLQRWKDFEKSAGVSSTDSAFGSDLEAEHESPKLSSEESKKKKVPTATLR